MPVRRLSPPALAYIGLAVIQLVMVLIVGGGGISIPGVILTVALFGYLSMGKPWAWWILVAMNSLGLLAVLIVLFAHAFHSSGHLMWFDVIVLVLATAIMEVALLSPSMRRHVASRELHLPPRR